MRTGHEAATLGSMTPTVTIHRCFGIGTADIYLCQTLAAVKMSFRNISEVKKITKILTEHLINCDICP